jgi:exopolyphosphatase/guanosine-5'-triphosphate,3'-diphosphate pyrophosphatase
MGCHRLIEPGEGPALVFDIGGGSTELILIETPDGQPRILDWLSVPWGVVSLSESVQHDDASPTARTDAYQRMMDVVGDSFSAFAARLPGDGVERRLLGTSGTVTTLASVHLGLPSYDRKMVDGLHVPSASFRDISSGIAAMSLAERAKLPCIGPERADLVVAGCAILDAILDIWPAHRVGVADRGIREGILRQLVHMDGRR